MDTINCVLTRLSLLGGSTNYIIHGSVEDITLGQDACPDEDDEDDEDLLEDDCFRV